MCSPPWISGVCDAPTVLALLAETRVAEKRRVCRDRSLLASAVPRYPTPERAAGKRATAIGTLRADILLYDEQDPRADSISAIARHDLSLRPDVLLIMGTSLATTGLSSLRDFAKVIHKRARKVVFVNLPEPAKSWDGVIDYWIEWDCDTWVRDLMGRQPALCCGNHEGKKVRDHVFTIHKLYLQDA